MLNKLKNKIRNKLSYALLDEDEEPEYNKPCPYVNSNPLTKFTFGWVTKLLIRGYFKEPLEMTDIFDIPNYLKSNYTSKYLNNLNLNSLNSSSKGFSKYPLIKYIYKEYIVGKNKILIFLQIFLTFLSILSPLCLKLFISHITSTSQDKSIIIGIIYCCLLFLSSFSFGVTQEIFYWYGMKCSLEVHGSLTSAVFKKALKLSNSSKKKFNSGAITNLMSVDVEVFKTFFWTHCIELFSHPIQIIVLLIFLCLVVGWSGLVGFIIMLLAMPVNSYFCNKSSGYLDKSLKYTDKRSNLTNELINGIRFIKMYAWEKYFTKKIESHREEELKLMFKRILFWIGDNIMIQTTSALVLVSTFATYSLLGHKITVETAFTSMNIFVNLRTPLIMFPYDIYVILSLLPSCRRIQRFLKCSEISNYIISDTDISIKNSTFQWGEDNIDQDDEEDEDDIEDDSNTNGEDDSSKLIPKKETPIDIIIEGKENTDESKYVLNNISFSAPRGKLTIICSPVGTGKTSFINALLGEINKVEGQVNAPDNVSYTGQVPFLLSASLRENILFGKAMDMDYYKKVIEACCLTKDLLQMAALDLTEIGERGINLSGGQKQRISLARALYSNSDCFIMDEPLSAVDPEVGSYLFNNCIQGMMANKTRILVTHQIQFIPNADHIILIENGTLVQGTYKELKAKGIDFESIMKTKKLETEGIDELGKKENEHSNGESTGDLINQVINDKHDPDLIERAKLLVEEDRNKGHVSFDAYKAYFRYGASNPFIIFTFILFLTSQVISQLSDFWLTLWTEQSINGKGQGFYITYYCIIILAFVLFVLIRYFMLATITFSCAKNLHHKLLDSISSASCLFFDQNPSGRILNRFSKDISDIDVPMLDKLSDVLLCYSAFIVGIVSIIYINPIMVIPFFMLMVLYYFVQVFYRPSAREMSRMESITLSPIYSLLQECYNGLVTIRSFKQQSRFIDLMYHNIDIHNRCMFAAFAINMWVSIRLEFLASTLVFFASLFSLFSNNTDGFAVLAVSTAMSMTGYLNWAIKQSVELEVKMNSFQRIHSYIQTPPEGKKYLETDSNLTNWPSKGEIQFNNIEIRYRPNSEPSLKNISFNVNSFEKIGIVGRTGAGKSTIGVSLFRMVECHKGSITIDGVDISKVGLHKLRSSLGVVPQDPWVFTGSIRSNIDPFNQYSDEEIWGALEKVKLSKAISEMPKKLNTKIAENGEGLSFGQKQLLSLTRTILKGSKVILMDEATSAIDYQTAALIKTVLSEDENFINSSMLTIAHRLDTIIDSSKIAIVDKGELVEFDTPTNLIKNEDSKFRKLVKYQTDFYEESKKNF
ncbi:hypothetical protein DICPUDRAFT_76449 [Dictyostelium purpureum]|uniref:ABC transporter C family protein n=1 Tax=Dictyostelium purpureum TaxID=5786 RepID=F0ZDM5_DICPU|nr:uncharacterized protein DICPUDRAFT_76449 [Dictyostelium purpureum]EGC37940.1 hypothetical protein DICPUDRAFT_76449 [Dictyostelium purpureum]|eukprot:XP_003285511.1 hypothetical protein DICPUDRAFT_76449 [Dictyostelium purpureum]